MSTDEQREGAYKYPVMTTSEIAAVCLTLEDKKDLRDNKGEIQEVR